VIYPTNRHYGIENLSFRDFWDTCRRFQTLNPGFLHVGVTVAGFERVRVLNEPDLSRVLKWIEGREGRVRKYSARFFKSHSEQEGSYKVAEMRCLPLPPGRFLRGLSLYSNCMQRIGCYQFGEKIRALHPLRRRKEPPSNLPCPARLVVRIALSAALSLCHTLAGIIDSSHFAYGTPKNIGAGIGFGLARHLEIGNDDTGRPISMVSRLFSACQGDRVYAVRAVPNLPIEIKQLEYVAHTIPYGRHNVWAYATNAGKA
jgi:hypothetical protein